MADLSTGKSKLFKQGMDGIENSQNLGKLKPDEWVERYSVYLLQFALQRVNDEHQAYDLVQDTFLSGLEQLDKFNYKSSEKTWLTGILKFKIFRVYRNRSSRSVTLVDFNTLFKSDYATLNDDGIQLRHPEVFEPFYQKEFIITLTQALSQLPELWQQVFELKYCEEKDASFICEKLNISLSYYWVICHRTKQSIKLYFSTHWL